MPVTIGADPELFLEDGAGKVISVIGKIGGSKEKPKPVKALGKGFAIQEDNVLLEYNIPAAKTSNQWVANHRVMLDYLRDLVGKMGLVLSNKASHSMDADQLLHPRAFIFGCEPDFDAWALAWNKKPESDDPAFRTGGAHVHIAYDNPNPAQSVKIARICDLLIGGPLALKDPDKKRSAFYGKPAAIRFKPYGLEYRTPSNYWIQSEANMAEVYRNAHRAVEWVVKYGNTQYDNYEEFMLEAARIIKGEAPTTQGFVDLTGTVYV